MPAIEIDEISKTADAIKLRITAEINAPEWARDYGINSVAVSVKNEIAQRLASVWIDEHGHDLTLKLDLSEISKLVLAQVLSNVAKKFGASY